MKRNVKVALLLALIVLAGFVGFKYFTKDNASGSLADSTAASHADENQEQKPPFIDLQPTIEAWANQQSGTASVVVYDLANQKNSASYNADQQYYTASIYKLYVAYEGYRKIADGTYSMDDPYLSGYSRGECLDAMIRSSYSPCGEKMWSELGKQALTDQMKAYGLKNTSLTGLSTSTQDSALILQRLYERHELSEVSTNLFLDSMKTQDAKYRRGLPSGFSAGTTVYNKVGWNEQKEWHDTAIVTLPNGRSYVIAVFTEHVGSNNIATLGKTIEAKLTE